MNLKKQIEEKVIKSFGLSDLSLKNRITIVFLGLMLTILGLISYDRLPKESFPAGPGREEEIKRKLIANVKLENSVSIIILCL